MISLRRKGLVDYADTLSAMQDFTDARTPETPDEIWLLQHPPTYTYGMNGLAEHLPEFSKIPVIKVDRGGQVTYHGPGQAVIYLLLDMKRGKRGVRELVRQMEQAVIDLLADYRIDSHGRVDAPGVYVGEAKIAALGLRVRRGCCYHGLALNVNMDLEPFRKINPCGYRGLKVTQLADFGIADSVETVGERLVQKLVQQIQKADK